MKQQNTKDLIVPAIRKVATQIAPVVNSKISDDDFYYSFMHITKYVRTLNLKVDEFTIVEGTIRMTSFSILTGYGHDFAVNDIEEWLLQNSKVCISGEGLAN
jgi:hypothetical protein